ncbi:MAG: lytic transglycosylase domain-containing protein [Desulfobacca sp.]|nr:lytic transglycosylase domain-containing protein [Desulfobacca sp.]
MSGGIRDLIVLILVLWWLVVGARAQNHDVKLSADGSMVITGATTSSPRPSESASKGEAELIASQIQVYIYRNTSQVCPPPVKARAAPPPQPARPASRPLKAPHLEPLIEKYARCYGVDKKLIRAVMRQESGFNPQAVSPKGAMGLMQLMPGTAALMGVTDPWDPEQNIAGGVKYLRRCLSQFQDLRHALAAYNAGPENVVKYNGCPPFAETRNYVASVMRTYSGVVLPSGSDSTYLPAQSPGRKRIIFTPSSSRWYDYTSASGIPVQICYSPSGKSKIIKIISRKER